MVGVKRLVLALVLALQVVMVAAATVVGAAPPASGGSAGPAGDWGWPLPGTPEVVRSFDPPDQPYGRGHRGVDLAAPPGTTVLAAGSGVVSFAGWLAGRGVVAVTHPNGLRTTYEPLLIMVRRGQHVVRGTVLGRLLPGHPGCPQPACLHWGLRRGEAYLDPLSLLRSGAIRLLPLAGAAGPHGRGLPLAVTGAGGTGGPGGPEIAAAPQTPGHTPVGLFGPLGAAHPVARPAAGTVADWAANVRAATSADPWQRFHRFCTAVAMGLALAAGWILLTRRPP